ncbi:hypothetical protein LIER_20618 [Lithospermum erythrorhizon]|uniref:Uncharacterized protein n=1 Tax=Lithospermum erythrorhizon TaxID=34254 RepID=A0AAV3QQ44_LITER
MIFEPKRKLYSFAMLSLNVPGQMMPSRPRRLWPNPKGMPRRPLLLRLPRLRWIYLWDIPQSDRGLVLPLPEGAILLEEGGETLNLPVAKDAPANP